MHVPQRTLCVLHELLHCFGYSRFRQHAAARWWRHALLIPADCAIHCLMNAQYMCVSCSSYAAADKWQHDSAVLLDTGNATCAVQQTDGTGAKHVSCAGAVEGTYQASKQLPATSSGTHAWHFVLHLLCGEQRQECCQCLLQKQRRHRAAKRQLAHL